MAKAASNVAKNDKKQRRRPVQARSLAKYQRILEVAPRVLQEKGYSGCTTELIALEAEVSIGTLYEYFVNKDDIFTRYLNEKMKAVTGQVTAQLAAKVSQPPGEILRWMISLGVDAVLDQHAVMRVLIREIPGLWEAQVIRVIETRILAYADFIYAQRGSSLTREDFQTVLVMLTQMVVGFYMRMGMAGESELSRQVIKRELVTMVRGYIHAHTGAWID